MIRPDPSLYLPDWLVSEEEALRLFDDFADELGLNRPSPSDEGRARVRGVGRL